MTTTSANETSYCAIRFGYLPCQSLTKCRPFLVKVGHVQGQIQCPERGATTKGLHGQSAVSHDVCFADLDHCAAMGDNVPRRLKQVPGERIQDYIHPEAVCMTHDLVLKVGCTRREDVISRNIVGVP